MKKQNHCPTCNKVTTLNKTNLYRPFCSERCRMIDLGEWIEEKYTVSDPVNSIIDDFDHIKH